MLHRFKAYQSGLKSSLTKGEEAEVENKVNAQLNDAQCKMVRMSLIINPVTAGFVFVVLYNQVKFSLLATWYAGIVLACAINFIWSFYYEKNKFDRRKLAIWRHGYHIILAVLCLLWGSISVLFFTNNLSYQLYIITFLQIALVAFNFGAMTDFTSTVINTVFMLMPFLAYNTYQAMLSQKTAGYDTSLNVAFSVSLIILGSFLVLTTFIGSQVLRRFFRLIFENVALSKKLENLNKFLEQRVKERTIELEKSLETVTYQATHDSLTDLPNQRLLVDYVQRAIQAASRQSHSFAVAFFMINEIEKINDGLGYQAGNRVIQTIAQRLQKKLREFAKSSSDKIRYTLTLSRQDVFVILLESIQLGEELNAAKLLFSVLDEPVHAADKSVKLTGSIGVSLYPQHGHDIQSLLMNADAAMLRSKQQGGNSIHLYQEGINANISKQLDIQKHLHDAVKNNEFILHYQPFVDLKTGKICGAEALIRWNSQALGFVSPMDFIPIAEATGSIIAIGEWVIQTACLQAKTWHGKGHHTLKIAINLSSKQLHEKNIVERIKAIMHKLKLDPAMIELELTESEAFQSEVIPILKQFKEMGFCLAIDDFGTGYSGLSNLKQFEIDILKIDKSFIHDIAVNEHSQAIVSQTIELGKKLGITVLAEGVETKDQLERLKQYGCDVIQGYYFSPPIHADAFTQLLETQPQFNV